MQASLPDAPGARHPLATALATGVAAAIDVLMPPTCVSCKAPVAAARLHCADCWASLLPPAGSRCTVCSVPLPDQWAAEAVCLTCLKDPPPFRQARAPYRYADVARGTVLAFKNGSEHLAPLMARAMLAEAHGLGPGGSISHAVIVPVPLHRWRIFRRGYNQAALLAHSISRETGASLAVDALQRVRPTRLTRGLNRTQRAAEMAGAFRVPPHHRTRIAGAHVLLVDDVLTTGATASACARALRRAGAVAVDVLTYARVAADSAGSYAIPSSMRGNDGQD